MKLASHNTMTYLKPKQWYFRWLLPFIGKCQRIDYIKQHKLGVNGYDLRLFWGDNGELEYRHGLIRYSAENINEVLSYAETNNIIVRVLLEIRDYNKKYIKDINVLHNKFISYCKEIEIKYPKIKFFGGVETGDFNCMLYEFKNKPNNLNVVELHGSVTSLFKSDNKILRVIDDLIPYIYARIMNKRNIRQYSGENDNTYLYIDYTDIQ